MAVLGTSKVLMAHDASDSHPCLFIDLKRRGHGQKFDDIPHSGRNGALGAVA